MRGDCPSDSVLKKVGALKADILIDITRPGCYALQYIALRHPSAFKVGIKYPVPRMVRLRLDCNR